MFRTEVLSRPSNRLHGDVAIFVPVAWQGIGYLMFAGGLAGLLFLSLAQYSRVETVTGEIAPAAGVSPIVPTRPGIITQLAVRDGQLVAAGAALAYVRAEEDTASGVSTAAQIEAAINRQDRSLADQSSATQAAARAQLSQLAAQRDGLGAELSQIRSQIGLQRDLVASAQRDLARVRPIADRGFISIRDLQAREETVLSRRQGLAQLNQDLAAKQSALAATERAAVEAGEQARAQNANLAASRAEVAQQAATANGARAYVLRAPMAGRVTALTARVGQPATPQTPLMAIIPKGAVLRAQLSVPTTAIGLVQSGQVLRLAIDAFSYQRFGTISGKILTVASSTVNSPGPGGSVVPVYPVTVMLDQTALSAYGRRVPLVSGMTLTARIVIEKQSLLQWLFDPLYAVQRR